MGEVPKLLIVCAHTSEWTDFTENYYYWFPEIFMPPNVLSKDLVGEKHF